MHIYLKLCDCLRLAILFANSLDSLFLQFFGVEGALFCTGSVDTLELANKHTL